MSKTDFDINMFDDESRNPFPGKLKKTLREALNDILPEISDADLEAYRNDPESLSDAMLQFIAAALENDKDVLARFINLLKK